MTTYNEVYERSVRDPEAFWCAAASEIDWVRSPSSALDASRPPFYRWYSDGVLNTCFNALDRQVLAGRGEQIALYFDSPVTGSASAITFRELTDATARFAGVLRTLGVGKGDRVLIYMPMVPQAVIAMLACARIGAIHSVVFGGFAASELAARIDDARPKVVVSASCGFEGSRLVHYKPLLDEARGVANHRDVACVILQRPEHIVELAATDHDWDTLLDNPALEPADCVPVAATDPLYILYTSGTTGRPKGIVRDNGGHAVALRWAMTNVFDIRPGDVFWAASDVGWVVGHSFIVYGPLLTGASSVLYEGKPVGTPDAGAFWRVVSEYRVRALLTAPTAIRALKKEDPEGKHLSRFDLSTFSALYLAGERLDPDTYRWATERLGVPVVDNWWQTETGWPIAANPRGLQELPIKAGSPSVPMPGFAVCILDEQGAPVPCGQEGSICIKLPLPPGTLPTVWGNDERYTASYLERYPGYYQTGDGGYIDEDGYLFVLGRTDDIMNVAGHRLSSGQIEAAIAGHPAVAECAVIGVKDALKGQVPRALVIRKSGQNISAFDLENELIARVRREVGPIAAPSKVDVVTGLPKTRSGKILRRTMRQLADGESPEVPSTIEDATVLDGLRPLFDGTPSQGAT